MKFLLPIWNSREHEETFLISYQTWWKWYCFIWLFILGNIKYLNVLARTMIKLESVLSLTANDQRLKFTSSQFNGKWNPRKPLSLSSCFILYTDPNGT